MFDFMPAVNTARILNNNKLFIFSGAYYGKHNYCCTFLELRTWRNL